MANKQKLVKKAWAVACILVILSMFVMTLSK